MLDAKFSHAPLLFLKNHMRLTLKFDPNRDPDWNRNRQQTTEPTERRASNFEPIGAERPQKQQTAAWSAAHNPEVAGSSPVSATRSKVPNSLRIGYFLFAFTPEMFDFSKAQKALFLLIYQQFINKCYLKALKTPKVGDWGLFFVVLIYYKNISYRYIKIIPHSPKIPRKP